MKRNRITPRPGWQETIFKQGLVFLTDPAKPDPELAWNQTPWQEDAEWEFTRDEIIRIESATANLYALCMEAVEYCVHSSITMDRMGISPEMQTAIRESWAQKHPSVYSRFDLAGHSDGQIKMIEINGDTPTALVESSLIQWYWLNDVHPDRATAEEPGQFNSLHERLLARWTALAKMLPENDRGMVFSSRTDFLDDVLTTEYLRDLATQAGFVTHLCDIRDVTLFENPNGTKLFGTPQREVIRTWFKLYPWEWLISEPFGADLIKNRFSIRVVEPAWKLLLSTKAILVVLWKLFPGHPNLMPAFFEQGRFGTDFVVKPQYGRESTGVHVLRGGVEYTTDTETANPMTGLESVYQGLVEIEPVDGYYPLFGSWIVGDQPAGMMVREDPKPIISGSSRIVPHFYR